jgi:predicted small metal-binding protein
MEGDAMSDRVIECPCGVVLTGADTAAVVATAQEHAREIHQMELTDDDARAMARPA